MEGDASANSPYLCNSSSPDNIGDWLGHLSPEMEAGRLPKKHARDGVSDLIAKHVSSAQHMCTWQHELVNNCTTDAKVMQEHVCLDSKCITIGY